MADRGHWSIFEHLILMAHDLAADTDALYKISCWRALIISYIVATLILQRYIATRQQHSADIADDDTGMLWLFDYCYNAVLLELLQNGIALRTRAPLAYAHSNVISALAKAPFSPRTSRRHNSASTSSPLRLKPGLPALSCYASISFLAALNCFYIPSSADIWFRDVEYFYIHIIIVLMLRNFSFARWLISAIFRWHALCLLSHYFSLFACLILL